MCCFLCVFEKCLCSAESPTVKQIYLQRKYMTCHLVFGCGTIVPSIVIETFIINSEFKKKLCLQNTEKLLKSPYMVILNNAAEIGKEIRRRRESLGVTLQQLADLTGIGINTLSRLERGVGGVTLKTLLSVVQTLGLKLGMEAERS